MSTKKFKHKQISFSNIDKPCTSTSKDKNNDEQENNIKPNYISHLQPEVLPLNLMKTLLITRGGGANIELEESLEVITKLFYQHITPKPQRIYKQNRRGTILTKKRNDNKSRKPDKEEWTILQSDQKKTSKENEIKSSKDDSTLPTETSQSRLKRPISFMDSEKKKIRLSSTSSTSSLDNIKINEKDKTKQSKTSEDTEEDKRESDVKAESKGHKKIKLERNNATESKANSVEETKKCKSKNLISWP